MIPGRMRSRVSGAFMVVNYGVRPVGALAGGALLGVLRLLPSPPLRLRDLPENDEGA